MNKYLYIFSGFLIAVFIIYLGTRADFGAQQNKAEASSGAKETTVLIKKQKELAQAKQELLEDTSGDYFLGSKHAPVVLIEYASLTCPHCAKFHSTVVEPLIKSHVNTGKVKYVYRDYPLNEPALKGAILARCAGPKKYFNFIKVLFKSQPNWAFSKHYDGTLRNIAKLGGINKVQYDNCMVNKGIEEEILKQKQDAYNILEVSSTPTVFINGIEAQDKHSYEGVVKEIDGYLKGEKQ